jgi:hypothetical protein
VAVRGLFSRIKFVYFSMQIKLRLGHGQKGNTITEYCGRTNCKATPSHTNPAVANFTRLFDQVGHAMSFRTCVHDTFGCSASKNRHRPSAESGLTGWSPVASLACIATETCGERGPSLRLVHRSLWHRTSSRQSVIGGHSSPSPITSLLTD